jgi:hypothetical protein
MCRENLLSNEFQSENTPLLLNDVGEIRMRSGHNAIQFWYAS